MQLGALCTSRRELSNAYLLAKFRFDTAENEPCSLPHPVTTDRDNQGPRMCLRPGSRGCADSPLLARCVSRSGGGYSFFTDVRMQFSPLQMRFKLSLKYIESAKKRHHLFLAGGNVRFESACGKAERGAPSWLDSLLPRLGC